MILSGGRLFWAAVLDAAGLLWGALGGLSGSPGNCLWNRAADWVGRGSVCAEDARRSKVMG